MRGSHSLWRRRGLFLVAHALAAPAGSFPFALLVSIRVEGVGGVGDGGGRRSVKAAPVNYQIQGDHLKNNGLKKKEKKFIPDFKKGENERLVPALKPTCSSSSSSDELRKCTMSAWLLFLHQ